MINGIPGSSNGKTPGLGLGNVGSIPTPGVRGCIVKRARSHGQRKTRNQDSLFSSRTGNAIPI